MRAWVLVAGFTGIRPQESYVLEWKHVKGEELVVEGTKTKTARRRIALLPIVRNALAEMPRADSPYVFVSRQGRQFTKGILQRNFDKVRIAVGNPSLTPYHLRHDCATNLLLRAVPEWAIAQQLGHSDNGKLVMQLYGHPQERDAQARIKAAYEGLTADLQQEPLQTPD